MDRFHDWCEEVIIVRLVASLGRTGVPSDCPLSYYAVPLGDNGAACSGRGAPVAALGSCQCFAGYDGPACGGCAGGYAPAGGLCQRTLSSFQAAAALSGRSATLALPAAPAPAPSAAAKVLQPPTDQQEVLLHTRTLLP